MAFEIPLDADQVDDLNLFSTLVRAPVIGTLLWIFGSSKGQSQSCDDELREQCIDDGTYGNESNANHQSSSTRGDCTVRQHTHSLKKAAPSLIGSEISEAELVESLDAVSLYGYAGSYSSSYTSNLPKKELSWSDEVGKNLVVYEAEVRIQNVHAVCCVANRSFVLSHCHIKCVDCCCVYCKKYMRY
jgi:hypothetical protein